MNGIRIDARSGDQLLTVACELVKEADAGRTVYLRPEQGRKLADALLDALSRTGGVHR